MRIVSETGKTLGYKDLWLKEIGGYETAKEINQQPRLWKELVEIFRENFDRIENYMKKLESVKGLRIIVTGAGTSAFVGESVVPYMRSVSKFRVEDIATTDIVANPEQYLDKDVPTLLISCARSGNSPESVAAVELAEQLVDELYQVMLTCNPDGKLAEFGKKSDKNLLLMMPEDSNDKGFAMTGSCTCMMLASMMLVNLENLGEISSAVDEMAKKVIRINGEYAAVLDKLAKTDFSRVVYLGAGVFRGLARESSLKLLELTGGEVPSFYDTPLGFRHGPKSILDGNTLVFMYVSNNPYTRKYDYDLAKEIALENSGNQLILISDYKDAAFECLADHYIYLNEGTNCSEDGLLIFPYLYNAQLFSLYTSIKLNYSPDNPCPSGSVNRVVQGVTIHAYGA